MEQLQQYQESTETRDTLFMLGGLSLMLFGAGLILSNPMVRRYLGQSGMNGLNLLQTAIPDVERYIKIRNM